MAAMTGTGKTAVLLVLMLSSVLLLAGCGGGSGQAAPGSAPPQPVTYFSGPVPRLIAHRGGKGLFPENTLSAFERSLALGVQILETDVWSTKDGQIVILHDEDVDRTTDGHGSVRKMTLAQVRQLDAAWWFTLDGGASYPLRGQGIGIPTLDEALQAFPDARFCIEIKQDKPKIEPEVVGLIEARGMTEKVCVGSFFDPVVERVRGLNPGICTGAGTLGIFLFMVTPMEALRTQEIPVDAFQIPEEEAGIPVLTPEFVHKAGELGIETHVWTINDQEDMRRILGMGVEGIITDYPDRLKEVIESGF